MKFTNVTYGGITYRTNKSENKLDSFESSHCHDRYEILYVIDGSGKYVVEGVEYPLKPRTLLLISPFVHHSVFVDTDITYERCVVHFKDTSLVDTACTALKEITAGSHGCVYYGADSIPNSVVATFDRLDTIGEISEELGDKLISLYLSELVIILSVSEKTNFASDEADIGARVVRYLNENIDRDISLDKLAKRFFVSKFYLCRAFKKHNGISIHSFINHKRVMYAKQLIESGEAASVAAYRVGFGDYSSFYRAFVKITGHAPTITERRIK